MPAASQSIVVVGGGQAAAWAAKTLRAEGYAGEISLVCEELHAPYERPALSKGVLAGTVRPETTQVFNPDVLANLNARWVSGVRATLVDRAAQRVQLADGRSLGYDKLMFCTGGRPMRPPIRGIELEGVLTLRTLDDCRQLADALARARRVCVIGGGWIGLEVASTATSMGKQVVVLERGRRLCERILPQPVSDFMLAVNESAGVEVHLNSGAEVIERARDALVVTDTAGNRVRADVVVVGAGLVANDELAAASGLACAKGIVVDSRCTTSDPNILAAGDVAVAPNSWAGGLVRLESWQNATEQAIVAAKVALGAQAQYDPLPWFWSDQHGRNVQIYGWPRPTHRTVTRQLGAVGSFLTFLLEGDVVAGVVGINAPKEVRAARKLIEQRKAVRPSDLVDPEVRLSSL